MWRPKTALSPKKIALWLLWIVSYAPFCQVGDLEYTCRTLDCWDSHFPTTKGPKYLQYSNSLNNTSIFHFIQLFSAMSSMFHRIYIHSYFQTRPFVFEVFLNPFFPPYSSIIVIIFPSCIRPLPQAFHESVRNIHYKAEQEAVYLWSGLQWQLFYKDLWH